MSPATIVAHEAFLTDVAVSAAEVSVEVRTQIIEFLEWHDVNPTTMVPGDENWFGSLIGEVQDALHSAATYVDSHDFPCARGAIGAICEQIAEIDFTKLNNGLNGSLPNLFRALFRETNRKLCAEFIAARQSFAETGSKLAEVLDLPKLGKSVAQSLLGAVSCLIDKGYGHLSLSQAKDFTEELLKTISALERIATFDSENLPMSFSDLAKTQVALDVADMLSNRPPLAFGRRLDGLVSEGAKEFVQSLAQKVEQYNKHCEQMASIFSLDLAPSKKELHTIARGLKVGQDSFLAFLKSDFRKAKNSLKTFSVKHLDPKAQETIDAVLSLAKVSDHEEAVKMAASVATPYLGGLYDGPATDFAAINEVMEWCLTFKDKIESPARCREILSNIGDYSDLIQAEVKPIRKAMATLKTSFTETLNRDLEYTTPIETHIKKLTAEHSHICAFVGETTNVVVSKGTTLNILRDSFQQALRYFDCTEALGSDRFSNIVEGDGLDVLSCDIETVRKALLTFEASGAAFVEGSEALGSAFTAEGADVTVAFLEGLQPLLNNVIEKAVAMAERLEPRQNRGAPSFVCFCSDLIAKTSLDEQQGAFKQAIELTEGLCEGVIYLQSILNYLRLKAKADELKFFPDLRYIIEDIGCGRLDQISALSHYRANLHTARANEIFRRFPEISGFIRSIHEAQIERFQKFDKEVLRLNQMQLAKAASRRSAPQGNKKGRRGEWTEKSLLEHQVTLKRRHLPIRQLVRRAGKALQAYKPCFMMSPLSVAQYLEPGYLDFDLVVMDEASQLRPEDALGGIIRGKQLVVVGDPKQLPPTSFFDKLSGEEESDDSFAIEDAESILDVCLNNFDKRRLRWHYRSEHESLIAFSNQRFFSDDLLVFPSPHHKTNMFGVRHHYIEGAIYKQRKSENLMEAEAVVQAIIRHLKAHPDLSLGVATFNKAQSDLISDRLEAYGKKDPIIERQIARYASEDEPFFIKNLENVQGDERDVIFISTTYGPNESGVVAQRFGPINMDVGWRRLNVIITRAKKRLEVFTSMRSSDIIAGENAKLGVKALKDYLEFLETGLLPERGKFSGREPDSDFEIDVARELSEHGFEVAAQIGVAGFFIDLAVVNPRRPGEFLLGIECDGASYHSAKSTRDRDRLRQEVLESKGWKIHRIWSTDWFVNREKEIERLLTHIRERLSLFPDIEPERQPDFAAEEQAVVKRIESNVREKDNEYNQLRNELIEYRKQNIDQRFVENGKGILSPVMLDVLAEKKPINKEEFYAFVPMEMRVKLDPIQLKIYLPDIFEIIEEYI